MKSMYIECVRSLKLHKSCNFYVALKIIMHLMPEDGQYWSKLVACVDAINKICGG